MHIASLPSYTPNHAGNGGKIANILQNHFLLCNVYVAACNENENWQVD